jgi:hypothetical protein
MAWCTRGRQGTNGVAGARRFRLYVYRRMIRILLPAAMDAKMVVLVVVLLVLRQC